jgi:endonuclease-3
MKTTLPQRITLTIKRLKKKYPDAHCALHYRTPFQLLVAVILSAQCTDKKVNEVMEPVFKKYKTAADFASIPLSKLEQMVRQTGFYKMKALAVHTTAKIVRDQFHNSVPRTMQELLTLRGVARKTANVVLGELYGTSEGVVVDTHVKRLSNRLGFTKQSDPAKIEQELMQLVPKKNWTLFGHLLITHGRQICDAKKPACDRCVLSDACPNAFGFAHFQKSIREDKH